MAMITDFEAWLDATGLETEEEADDLIVSVQNVGTAGDFVTTKKNGRFFVTGPGVDTLLLVNEPARLALIAEVKRRSMPHSRMTSKRASSGICTTRRPDLKSDVWSVLRRP